MEKSDSNIGLFFCSHSRPNSSEGSAKESRRAGTAEYVKLVRLAPKDKSKY